MRNKLLLFIMLSPILSMCQQIEIRGRIINEQNEPIAAATVTLKRTGHTTLSDENGNFTIHDSRLSDTLIITAAGYETRELPNNERGQLTIIMFPASTSLQEVIINTGYQVIPKERSTGSFTTVTNQTINLQTGLNILDRMEAVTSAVLFDKNSSRPPITVRGLSTINGPKSPLVILDNFPFEGGLNTINPNDVESITVLKDAAAASVWGTRAGNGVIVITTKAGKFNRKLKIDLNSNITITLPPDFSYLKLISANDFIELEQFLFSRGFYNSQENSSSKPVLSPVVELMIRKRNGQITDNDLATAIDNLSKNHILQDYENELYRQSTNRQYALSLSGGSPSFAYSFSGGYDDNTSNLDAVYKRITFRSTNQFKMSDRLQLHTSLNFANTITENGRPSYSSLTLNSGQRLWPYARLIDDTGNSLGLYQYRQVYIDTAGQGKLLDWKLYPLEDYKYNNVNTKGTSLLANLGLNYKLIRWLSLDLKYQHEKQWVKTDHLRSAESYFTRDLVNRFTQINRTTGAVTYIVPNSDILDKNFSELLSNNLRSQLNFDHDFNRHRITAIAGMDIRQVNSRSSSHRIYGYDDEVITLSNMDFVNTYPTFITGSRQQIPNNQFLSEGLNRYVSFYGNGAYTFNKKYTISASARRDASNLFGVNTNDRWKPLWSAGAAWDISKENFYKLSSFPFLKFRMTYGYSGNVDPSRSGVTTIRYFSAAPLSGFPYATISQNGDPELRWEETGMFNFGLDFQHKRDRISGSIEYYFKKGKDLFGPAPLDYTTGLVGRTITKNVASMKGRGIDLVLNTLNVDRQLKWTSTLLFNYNTSEITGFYLNTTEGSNFINSGSSVSRLPGQPVYAITSYQWSGLDSTGNPVGVLQNNPSKNYSGIIGSLTTIEDLVVSGSALPTFFGSLSNTMSWKGISITALISFKAGHYFKKEALSYGQLFSQNYGHGDYARRWQKPGDEIHTHVPVMIYPNNSQRDGFYTSAAIHVEKADLLRLQFLNLTYTIPVKLKGLQLLQAYFVGSELGLIWTSNKDGIDPDFGNSLPPSASYSFGLRASF